MHVFYAKHQETKKVFDHLAANVDNYIASGDYKDLMSPPDDEKNWPEFYFRLGELLLEGQEYQAFKNIYGSIFYPEDAFFTMPLLNYVTGISLMSLDEAKTQSRTILLYQGWWWLKTPSPLQTGNVCSVSPAGEVFPIGMSPEKVLCIRPRLSIPILKDIFQEEVPVNLFGFTWDLVGQDGLLYADGTPLRGSFNNTTGSDDYQQSGIKEFIETEFIKYCVNRTSLEDRFRCLQCTI